MNSGQILMEAAPIASKAFAAGAGVKLNFVPGAQPSVNLKTKVITIPSPPIEGGSEGFIAEFWACIHHECGHVVFTDPSVEKEPSILGELLNCIEDPRMEGLHQTRWPGAKARFDDGLEWLAQQGHLKTAKPDSKAVDVLISYVLSCGYYDGLGRPGLEKIAKLNRKIFEEKFSKNLAVKVKAITCSILEPGKKTIDALHCAEEIVKLVEEESKDQPPEEPKKNESSDKKDDAKPKSKDKKKQSGDNGDDGKGIPKDGGKIEAKKETKGNASECRKGNKAAKEVLEAISKGVCSSVKTVGELTADALGGMTSEGAVTPLVVLEERFKGSEISQSLILASKVVGGLSARLRNHLVAPTRKIKKRQLNGNRLDTSGLFRLFMNDNRLFKSKQHSIDVDTSIVLLLDLSGSMSKRRRLALNACLGLTMALEPIKNVKTASACFRGHSNVMPLKFFGENVRNTAAYYETHVAGYTPMISGLMWAAEQLSTRKSGRNIIVTITDGMPDDLKSTQDFVKYLQKSGVELWGIGIESEPPTHLFNVTTSVTDVTKLQEELIRLFKSGLSAQSLRRKNHV